MPEIITIPVGALESNCYLVFCEKTRETIVVDPGEDAQIICKSIDDNRLNPVYIINTHGHVDHIGANGAIKERFNVPIAIHACDADMLINPKANLSVFIGDDIVSPPADQLLNDGDILHFGDEEMKVIHTPGHSQGGICLHTGKILISGDTLFKGSVGRSDLPGSDYESLMDSLQNLINSLKEDTVVYPGHGPKTTIGTEKRSNPFLIKSSCNCCR